MSTSNVRPRVGASVVKEGYLFKRGEHIKNWRSRFFYLFDDGTLLGFKAPLAPGADYSEPLNDFTVKDCQIMKVDHVKQNAFVVRGLQWTSVIERTFHAKTAEDRDAWISAIGKISSDLNKARHQEEELVNGVKKMQVDGEESAEDRLFAEIMKNNKKITLEDFEFLKMLGKGTFGKVMLCREKKTSNLYAIKVLKKEVIIAKDEVEHTLTESRVLQTTKHPFLTGLKYAFQTKDRLCFVMEFAVGGDLYFHLNREVQRMREGFSEERTKFYGGEIILALQYLHQNNIVYRDLKLENLLLDRDGHIKIADFGLCKEKIPFGGRTKTFCGTPEYLAPEVLEDTDYGIAVDWWGVGVVMYEMMCGRLPFYSREHERLFELILTGTVRYPSRLSPQAKALLNGLLVKDPQKRLGGGSRDADEIKEHPFFDAIDWAALYDKLIEPPFKPQVTSDTDTSCFDQEFTGEPVALTPPGVGTLDAIEEEEPPYFQQFSFHGSRNSLANPSSSSAMEMMVDETK